jgi:pimeloyl-ACP methyl ester carboxylesterase
VSFVDLADGARLHFEIAGEGPVVTLIHPGLWDMRTWDREFERFADAGYRVLRYDVRGYGESSRPEPGATYSHVRDLDELLEAAEVTQTALVGCSMGGGIAIDFALGRPAASKLPRRKRNGGRSATGRSRP